ncbi:MAG TPA: N-acetylglucosamine-6-phosphate deacetylase [Verrucomicrobiae bacterium]|nr:N-acetylglucosamine-6-phosphate deacetylase [Verrucomicrobiae bacterium]
MKNRKLVLKGRIITPDNKVPVNGFVEIQGETITSVGFNETDKTGASADVCDFGAAYICPGFIDLHVHGSGGSDVMDGTGESLETMARSLADGGTTAFLATTMSAPLKKLVEVIKVVRKASQEEAVGARVMGIHLEGPYLNPDQKGAQRLEYLQKPSLPEVKGYVQSGGGTIKMLTLAPELPGSKEVIEYAKSQGIVVSLGHSKADFDEVSEAFKSGLSHATHTFNAMGGLHHREVGTAGAVLGLDGLTADVIPDGVHVDPKVIKILLKAKGMANVCVVTDCIRAGRMGDGAFELGGQAVWVKNGVARLRDGTISGSVISMNEGLKVLVNRAGLCLSEAVMLASKNPARILGLKSKGALKAGMDADVTVLDNEFKVIMTLVGGRVVSGSLC